ncbi:DNA repair protein RadC [Jeotgalibaca porci]|uniref:DNA repair protein RadC n=1 Tax=Jeotgalibaca porci TaxID=1868793 RepID=A0A6G7WJK2_9LACT|nr:JAB domain-containing protein [Jeotgalibaca porci]QIK52409.1 DNA repair protein RadC [Jeotgalibaca porci]
MLEQLNLLTEQETITEIVRVKQVVMERPVAYAEGITSTERAGRLGMNEIGDEAQEVVLILILNTKNQINAIHRVFTGSLNSSVAHPREIFRSAILNNGARIILYHNHPSSDLEPSQADLYFTARIVEAGIILGIEVLDHIIVSDRHWFSFKDFGFFEEI